MRASNTATNLIAGTVTRYMLLAVNIGVGIFLMPFTIAHLGTARYGLWMLVASTTYYFGLLDLGYDSGLVRHIVGADAKGDIPLVNRIASTFVCVYSIIGTMALAGTAVLALLVVPRFPHLSAEDVRIARIILAILGVRIAIGFPMTVFGAVTTARQGFALNNTVDIALNVTTAIVTYVVLASGGGLVLLVFSTTAVSLLGYVAYARTARHMFPALRIRPQYFSRSLWREVTTFSLYLFAIDIAAQIALNVDNVLIGAFLGTTVVAVYAVAVRLSDFQRRICDQFSGMLFPIVVGIEASRDQARLAAALVEGTRVAVALVTGVTICLVGFARPLIAAWIGPGFEGAVAPLYALAVVGVVMVSHAAGSSILLATGAHRLVAWVWAVEALANLMISLALVRRFGAAGVAVGTAIPIAIGHTVVIMPAACRRVGLSVGELARVTLRPALISAGPAILLCGILRLLSLGGGFVIVIGEGAAVGLTYVVVAACSIDAPTRHRYANHLRLIKSTLMSTPASAAVS